MTQATPRNTAMALNLLAMTGLPCTPEDGDEGARLVLIDRFLEAAGCSREVSEHLASNTSLLDKLPSPTSDECVWTLRRLLDKTHNADVVLDALALRNTRYFMVGESRDSMFDSGRLRFFEDFCRAKSVRDRLELAKKAIEAASKMPPSEADLALFAWEMIDSINFPEGSPAYYRVALVDLAIEQMLDANVDGHVPPAIAFMIGEIIRLNSKG